MEDKYRPTCGNADAPIAADRRPEARKGSDKAARKRARRARRVRR